MPKIYATIDETHLLVTSSSLILPYQPSKKKLLSLSNIKHTMMNVLICTIIK